MGAGVEQSGLEIPERGADFVENRGSVLADVAREPEQLHLALHLLLDQLCFVSRGAFAREEFVGNARLQSQQRAARGLGRMRGEDRTHVESEQRGFYLLSGAAHLAELPHRPAYRCRLGCTSTFSEAR